MNLTTIITRIILTRRLYRFYRSVGFTRFLAIKRAWRITK